MEQKLLTAKELQERWGVCKHTLYKWRRENKTIPYVKIGGKYFYKMSDVLTVETSR